MGKPYDPKDFYFRKAKKQGLRARSAFKIDEILHRQKLLRKGEAVLDLGAAPGGFLQILAEVVGETGLVVGVDLEPIRNLGKAWVKTAVVDLLAPDAIEQDPRHLARSPSTSSRATWRRRRSAIKVTDEARSLDLCRMAMRTADETLKLGGSFVTKVFMGGDFPIFSAEVKERYERVDVARPKATREHSYEVFVIGKGFLGRPNPVR